MNATLPYLSQNKNVEIPIFIILGWQDKRNIFHICPFKPVQVLTVIDVIYPYLLLPETVAVSDD
jgi:hypothetical protein